MYIIFYKQDNRIYTSALTENIKNQLITENTELDFAEIEEEEYRKTCIIPDGKAWFYSAENGLELKDYKEPQPSEEEQLNQLRALREDICFPIINRSQLWYNRLTDEQKVELNTWYDAWLKVTETKIVPEKPAWLK